jgi:hypothetical protein
MKEGKRKKEKGKSQPQAFQRAACRLAVEQHPISENGGPRRQSLACDVLLFPFSFFLFPSP